MKITPLAAALLALLLGSGLGIGGVYLLAGAGWALIAGAAPCFGLAITIFRGLRNG